MESTSKETPEITENNKIKKRYDQGQPLDGGWGWVVVFASLIVSMLSDGVIYSYGVLTPEFIQHYNLSRSAVGWMGSVLAATTLAVGPLASILCKKFGYRICGIIGSIISAVSFFLPYFYSELWFLILCTSVLAGIGFGLVYLPSIIIVNVWFEKKRSLAMGIAVCGSGLGTFVMSPLIEYLVSTHGWVVAMLIIGLILLIMAPCCLTYVNVKPRIPEEVDLKLDVKNSDLNKITETIDCVIIEIPLSEEEKKEEKKSFVGMMKDYVFLLFIVMNILSSIGFNAPYLYAKDRAILQGLSDSKGSFLISSIGIGSCIGRITFGLLGTLKSINRFHLFNATIIISGVSLIASWVMTSYIFMIIYTFTFGLMSGASVALAPVILIDMFGLVNVDTAFSITLVVQGVSVLIGPPFAGFLYDATMSFNVPFAVSGASIALSGLIMYFSYFSKDFRKKKFY